MLTDPRRLAFLFHAGMDDALELRRFLIDVLPLARTEFRMLEFFMSRPERVFSREQLIARLWGSDTSVEDRTIDVCIRRLRMALEPFGMDRYIQTVRSAGYRFSNKAQ